MGLMCRLRYKRTPPLAIYIWVQGSKFLGFSFFTCKELTFAPSSSLGLLKTTFKHMREFCRWKSTPQIFLLFQLLKYGAKKTVANYSGTVSGTNPVQEATHASVFNFQWQSLKFAEIYKEHSENTKRHTFG